MASVYSRLIAEMNRYRNMTTGQVQKYNDHCIDRNDSCFHVAIRDGTVLVKSFQRGYQTRAQSSLDHIARVAEKHFPLPDVDIVVDVGDGAKIEMFLNRPDS